MGYPFGKAPLADGTGTTPGDLQRILGAQYMTAGILPNGGLTVSGTTSMAYKVEPGACFMWTSFTARLGMLVPVDGVTVPTSAAPSTGSRIDTVYVDGSGVVRVAAGQSRQPEGVAIARFTVPAGITATTSAQMSIDRDFAIPVGASLGRLSYFHDPATDVAGNVSAMTLGSGRFYLPSDRMIRFDMTHCISAEQDPKTSGGEATVMRWRLVVDGKQTDSTFTTRAEWDQPQTNQLSLTMLLSEGTHTVAYIQDRLKGARFIHRKGGAGGYIGNRFEVWDAGVSR